MRIRLHVGVLLLGGATAAALARAAIAPLEGLAGAPPNACIDGPAFSPEAKLPGGQVPEPAPAPAGARVATPETAPSTRAADPPPDLDFIIREAQRVQLEDTAAWPRFRFRRRVYTERLDAEGNVTGREDLEFAVTPKEGGFDEALERIDGRQPTPKEVSRHRRLGRFTRHYEAARSGEGSGALGGGYSLSLFLNLSSYRYAGREEIDGVECHRLDFVPQERRERRGFEARLATAMGGSLWISVDGYHLVRARTRMVRPVSVILFFFSLRDLAADLDSTPAAPGVWLPRRIEVRADARVSWWPLRRHSVLLYWDFTPVSEARLEDPAGGGEP